MSTQGLGVGEREWVKSDCQHSFGMCARNRMQDDFGRFFGSGVTAP